MIHSWSGCTNFGTLLASSKLQAQHNHPYPSCVCTIFQAVLVDFPLDRPLSCHHFQKFLSILVASPVSSSSCDRGTSPSRFAFSQKCSRSRQSSIMFSFHSVLLDRREVQANLIVALDAFHVLWRFPSIHGQPCLRYAFTPSPSCTPRTVRNASIVSGSLNSSDVMLVIPIFDWFVCHQGVR